MNMRFLFAFFTAAIIFTACENGNGSTPPPVIPDIPPLPYPHGDPPAATGDNPYETGGGGASMNRTFFNESGISVEQAGYNLNIQGPFGRIEYDVNTGLTSIFRTGDTSPVINNVFAEAVVNDWPVRTYALIRDSDSVHVHHIRDGFGEGVRVTVRSWGGRIIVWQNYYIYPNRNYLIFDMVAELTRFGPARTNYMAPLIAGKDGETTAVITLAGSDRRFLAVPFDNDEYTRFNSRPLLGADSESYEVTAVFDNNTRRGFIAGSVSHDTWKTGIRLHRSSSSVHRFRLFNGITSFHTRDTGLHVGTQNYQRNMGDILSPSLDPEDLRPHGTISGTNVTSSKMFLGFYNDWRDGLEAYGRAVGVISPPLYWAHGVPFGWNSWSAYASQISYETYVETADFIKDHLPHFNNGVDGIWMNLDSWWSNLSPAQQTQAVNHLRSMGQNAGIYSTPFTTWNDNLEVMKNITVPGAPDFTMYDLLLKDKDGNPLKYMGNKGWALDPTHPGTAARNDFEIRRFLEWGFRFVKLDFMSHGTMEGDFYNKSITTGKQAYSYGMQRLLESMGRELTRGNFFVSLSIAPIFPSQYAHARRISCDIFGRLRATEYMLNNLSYSWWTHNSVYPFNDPDSIVVFTATQDGQTLYQYNEGMSRYIAAAITGGMIVFGEDITRQEAAERVIEILNNPRVNALASSSRTFRPVEGNTGSTTGELFVRDDRELDGNFYLAAFNLNRNSDGRPTTGQTMNVNLERIGLTGDDYYSVFDVITGSNWEGWVNTTMTFELTAGQPKIFALRLQP